MEPDPLDPDTTLPQAASPTPSPSGSAFPGAKSDDSIPGYRIGRELGRGGMGIVFHARQIRADRDVALKMILNAGMSNALEAARFQAEALAASRLQHPAIVAVYEVGETDGSPWFSMEHCPGGSLASTLRGKRLDPLEAARLLHKIAVGVAAAHAAGIVHRDLKPGNILLSAEGEPKIADFGLAKLIRVGNAAQGELTATGAILGTPTYMAPEQASAARTAGPPADVYALGVMLYEFLVGHPPFQGQTATDTLLLMLTEDPKPPRQVCPSVPGELEAVCLRCLEKDPSRRYPTARELGEDLARFVAGEPILTSRSGGVRQMVGAIGRVRLHDRFSENSKPLLMLAPVMLIPEIWTTIVVENNWAVWIPGVTQLVRFILFLFVIGWHRQWRFAPNGPAERQLWMVWGGYVVTCTAYGVSRRLVLGIDETHTELQAYQGFACLAGLAFFTLAATLWGYCAIIGAAFLGVSLLMAIDLRWAPLEYGLTWAIVLLVIGLRLRALGRARAEPTADWNAPANEGEVGATMPGDAPDPARLG